MTDIEKTMARFEICWGLEQYEDAVRIYINAGRPYWLADDIAKYLESQGRFEESIHEWAYFVDALLLMTESVQLMLHYQREVFMLGAWHASIDKARAIKYLGAYLRLAKQWKKLPGLRMPYKNRAARILQKLQKSSRGVEWNG